jgi:hypothetical protein
MEQNKNEGYGELAWIWYQAMWWKKFINANAMDDEMHLIMVKTISERYC